MLLDPGGTDYRPVEWDEAFAIIAEELNALASPNDAIFYTSGRASNEAAFLRSEEHTSELQSHSDLVCRLLLEKKKKTKKNQTLR